MSKKESRATRWAAAVEDARAAYDEMDSAFEILRELQSEYEEWRDNLPESLQSSAVGEKLDAVCDLDLDIESILDVIEECDLVEMPQGFGRD